MPINAKHLSPGRAIEHSLVAVMGAIELAKAGEKDMMLSLYFEGEPGVGKSSIGRAIARALNYKFVDRRANMLNPDDAAGTRMQDMVTKKTEWFPPDWMPNEDGSVEGLNEDGKPYDGTVLMFDELASADDRVRKPLFGAFLDRSINDRRFPDNCVVLAAGNEAETGTMVFELDNATRTRFSTIRVIADFAGWEQDFAPGAGITATCVSYLKQNIQRFCETERAMEQNRTLYGNPRSWEHVSKFERAIMRKPEDARDEVKREALASMIAGKVGSELAAEYMGVFDTVSQMATLYDMLKATKEERRGMWPKSIGELYALTYSMMSYPSTIEEGKRVIALADEMPKEGAIPFQEMRGPVLEVILKRLKALGIKAADVSKAFRDESEESAASIFDNGPLLKLK